MIGAIIISMLMNVIEPQADHLEYIDTYTISAYSETGNRTASGKWPTPYETVATSDDFPFGTELYIEDVGRVVVEDRGGELISSGERIDLYIGNENPYEVWGLQDKEVYIIKRGNK